MPVVDASVWVSLCHGGDRFHGRCRRWFEAVLGDEAALLAPTLLLVEVGGAIRRLTGDASLAASAVAAVAAGGIELAPLTVQRGLQAAEIARDTAVRGADAVYLQLAREYDDLLVTLDRQQLDRGTRAARVQRP